jgi:hypothetical protein
MLNYYHFEVKEPYYKSAAEGKLDFYGRTSSLGSIAPLYTHLKLEDLSKTST